MKTVIYFIISLLSLLYIGVLCYLNIGPDISALGSFGKILSFVGRYGGVIIIFVFAFSNFIGNPLKVVFFILLVLVGILFLITSFAPGLFSFLK